MNWRRKSLTSYEIIVNLIGNTTNSSELKVRCGFDPREYAKGIKVSDMKMESLNIKVDEWHGEWNYVISEGETQNYLLTYPYKFCNYSVEQLAT